MPDRVGPNEAFNAEELQWALQGGLKGRLARGFCVMQGGLDALSRYLERHADEALRADTDPILQQLQKQLLVLERLCANTADLAVGVNLRAPQALAPLELGGYLQDLQRCANEELLRIRCPARVRVEGTSADGGTMLLGSENLMNTLFANLFSNSAQARADACITLRMMPDRRLLYLDDGPGLPEQELRLLCGEAKGLQHGQTGLLLAACCAEALGWQIEPADRDGDGFALEIRLPEQIPSVPSSLYSADGDGIRIQNQQSCLRQEFAATLA